MLEYLVRRGTISEDVQDGLSITLIMRGYRFVRFSARTLMCALRRANWNPEDDSVKFLLREARVPFTSNDSVAAVLTRTVFELYNEPSITKDMRDPIIAAIAATIRERDSKRDDTVNHVLAWCDLAFEEGHHFMFQVKYELQNLVYRKNANDLSWLAPPRRFISARRTLPPT